MRGFFCAVSLCVLPLLAACQRGGEAGGPEPSIPFRIDGALDFIRMGDVLLTIDIEIADSDSARQRGMMQRTSFPANTGMLFLFEREEVRNFWMGNTPLSLDLLFVGADSQIVDFSTYAKPFSDEPIASRVHAQHVLEMPAGFVDLQGLVEGDRVRWRLYGE